MNDYINGAFELIGSIFSLINLRRILRDKYVAGVDWRVTAFWSAWGTWNLFYYPSLDQWASFYGGLLLVLSNTAWVVLALKYSRKKQPL